LSPLRPHTTMAIEKLKMAAREAQPRVISTTEVRAGVPMLPRVPAASRGIRMVRIVSGGVGMTVTSPVATRERERQRSPYPNYRVIVLDDDVNTFQHVVDVLVKHLPGMQPDRAWELAHRIDGEGSAVVWSGPQEQAELYHQLLGAEGLTMAPLERA